VQAQRKILVVDDAAMFRDLESLFLARCGQVLTACDGDEAWEILHRERPDIVVTDLAMPGMGGDELCRRIKGDLDLRRTPVIVVAGREVGEEHERAVRAGADDVVEKPIHRVSLIQAVNHFLRLAVRGLVRVKLETDVRIAGSQGDVWAWSRNVSRGGIFVESERDLPPDLPEIWGDAPALRRALDNLVANAVKFAPAGRQLALRVSARPAEGTVVLRVEDRGPGIPREEREQVFEPFYRGKAAERNKAPGSGLGLSLVRHVVRAHGGRVHVEGREGGGTAVVLELPAVGPEGSA